MPSWSGTSLGLRRNQRAHCASHVVVLVQNVSSLTEPNQTWSVSFLFIFCCYNKKEKGKKCIYSPSKEFLELLLRHKLSEVGNKEGGARSVGAAAWSRCRPGSRGTLRGNWGSSGRCCCCRRGRHGVMMMVVVMVRGRSHHLSQSVVHLHRCLFKKKKKKNIFVKWNVVSSAQIFRQAGGAGKCKTRKS